MNDIKTLSKIEFIFLMITIIFTNIILNIPSIIISLTGTGSWINIIYVTLIALFFVIIISKLFNFFMNSDILDISEIVGGSLLRFIMALLYIILFFVYSIICLRLFANSLRLIYFDSTPLVLLFFLFLIPVAIVSKLGLKSISSTNIVIILLSIITFFVYFFAASRFFTWQRISPYWGYGLQITFLKGINNIFSFNFIAYLFFLKPFLKDETAFKRLCIMSVLLCGFFLLLSLLALLLTFSFATQINETLSVFIVTRLISFGNFFQRVDALITFIWIFIILLYLSFNTYMISHIIGKTVHLKNHMELAGSIAALIFSFGLIFKDISTLKTISEIFYKTYTCILIFIISFVILLIGYIKRGMK